LEGPGKTSIIGLYTKSTGHLPCVNSDRTILESIWEHVDPKVKVKNARIARFEEVFDDQSNYN
jgi:hypothetical protein